MTDISCFVPHVQKHVEVVLSKRHLGLSREGLEIRNPQTSSPSFVRDANCDRFTIAIPYAGTCVEFTVMFQATQPECPPDFLFSDLKFFVPIDEMETLRTWDVSKSDGLLNVVKEIMLFYKKKNIEDLEKYTDLNYEYLSLFQIRHFNEDDIEVYVPYKSKTPITMLVRLHVEFCDKLPDITKKASLESAYLLLIFSDRDNEKCSQRLYLSDEIKNAIGLNGNFEFPGTMREFQLNRYIIAVEDKLRCQVELTASRYESRKTYFAKFLSHFYNCVIEYDILYFYSMVLLLEVEDFNFLLEINLPESYPLGIPDLVFRSIYHTCAGVPTSVVIDSYPYCSTWSLDKVFTETVRFIQAYAILLKEDSDPYFCEYAYYCHLKTYIHSLTLIIP